MVRCGLTLCCKGMPCGYCVGNEAPSCVALDMSGFTNAVSSVCADALNRRTYLEKLTVHSMNRGGCLWYGHAAGIGLLDNRTGYACAAYAVLQLIKPSNYELILDIGPSYTPYPYYGRWDIWPTYHYRLVLGPDAPDCMAWSGLEIPLESVDAAAAKCGAGSVLVAAANSRTPCRVDWPWPTGVACGPVSPDQYVLTIAGLALKPGYGYSSDPAIHDTDWEDLNGQYVLTRKDLAYNADVWEYHFPSMRHMAIASSSWMTFKFDTIRLSWYSASDTYPQGIFWHVVLYDSTTGKAVITGSANEVFELCAEPGCYTVRSRPFSAWGSNTGTATAEAA